MLRTLIDWILHIDAHLAALASSHAVLVYVVLFAVIFIETGVVVLPFLPGDSLLFVAGTMAAQGIFSFPVLVPLLMLAAILGDSINFAIGSHVRNGMADEHGIRFVKPEYLKRTHDFFDRHGRKTIVLARFVPVVRTFAPFVAALGDMPYGVFLAYNVIGGVVWVGALIGAGAVFGNLPWVAEHLTLVILGIVAVSLLPGVVGWMTGKRQESNRTSG
ncbi:VTT domain-containing protein [Massilia norwichensis]|uniref:VTT domain-containing protein n=1 Tax=Massilia norwichensis TaxID=1442366 RepID=A0ABT2A2G5_9BURK|nr:VTT domain-containing protein [Massilia norwichensis]MCS0588267.1 VTT domain-containing protein [Massilia norwichensis]